MNKDPLLDACPLPRQYTLLTGATGLVGQYLMRDLFLKGCRLAVVVRPTRRMDVHQRIESIMQRWESELGRPLPRPIVFEGDVCQTDLGLGAEDVAWVEKNCDQLIHSAAVLQFNSASREDDPWRTNLGGTQNVLELARETNISDFHYVSTAYVCGEREQAKEDELDCGQAFRNDYERSKFEAEKLVAEADFFETRTVYRPAVIVGDSETGYTSTYHGLFLYLRLLDTLVPQQTRNEHGVFETPIRLPMNGDEPRNLVPVDWVSKIISHLFCTPESHGRTYHLSPDRCTTAREVIEHCYEYFNEPSRDEYWNRLSNRINSCGVEFCGSQADRDGDNEFSQRYFQNVSIYQSYETSDPVFDKTHVERFAAEFKCPVIDKPMILRFLEFGKSDRWGKKRKKVPQTKVWDDTQLRSVAKSAAKMLAKLESGSRDQAHQFGLDLQGPGGGQWIVKKGNGDTLELTRGLPDGLFPVLTMDHPQILTQLIELGINGATVDGADVSELPIATDVPMISR